MGRDQLEAPTSKPSTPLQSFARYQDEQNADGSIDEHCHGEDHDRPANEELPNIRLAHAGEVEGRVFAQADQCEDGIQRVLIRRKAVDANCEGEDELRDD